MDIDAFTELADQLMERVPSPILEGLNGGVVVRRRAMRHKNDPHGVYVMGEYVTDPAMGAYVVLYYGSFVELLGDEPAEAWELELWDTIRHELRHHLEARAGVGDLDLEDEVQLAQLQAEAAPAEAEPPPRRFRLNRPIRQRPEE